MSTGTDRAFGGRPATDDLLAVFLFMEHQRTRYPDLSVRDITACRDVRFSGMHGLGGQRETIAKETLRRRYGKAKSSILPTSPNVHVQIPDDHPVILETNAIIKKMLEDLYD